MKERTKLDLTEDYAAEIKELREYINSCNQRIFDERQCRERCETELDELKEKYARLLRTHIDMMERCVGIYSEDKETGR